MKGLTILSVILFVGILAGISLPQATQPASAGGWPCFLCHGGFEVVGTDLAPALAGSKLTDEQILAQVRQPRGLMPAFSKEELSDQVLQDGFIEPFMRGVSTGKPTAVLDPPIRSIALATLAAVAQARATQYARNPRAENAATPVPAEAFSHRVSSPNPLPESVVDPRVLALFGGLLALISLGGWFATRR